MNILGILKDKIKKLLQSRSTPSEIALGVAIGVFVGMLPLYGFHVFLWLLASVAVPRANKVAIFLGTNISIPPLIPAITWAGYGIGRHILGSPPISLEHFTHLNIKTIGALYVPLFVGCLILGVIGAILSYGITYVVVEARQERRRIKTPSF